jgi:long-chain acyl-CoA synthetase
MVRAEVCPPHRRRPYRYPEDVVQDTQTLIGNRPPSVAELFLERVERTPDAEACRYPTPSSSAQGAADWKSLTWAQAAERVYRIAAA